MRSGLTILVMSAMTVPAAAQYVDASAYRASLLRMPGYVIAHYETGDDAAMDAQGTPGIPVQARVWEIRYGLVSRATKADPRQIVQNHVDQLVKHGGSLVLDAVDPARGTVVAHLPMTGLKVWIEVRVDEDCEAYTLKIVEEAPQRVVFGDADLTHAFEAAMAAAPYDISFDAGTATLRPESAQALAPVGDLLRNQPSLRLEIHGHSDMVEIGVDDLTLSQARADAVKAYLMETFAIAADRLTTRGFGGAQPLAYTAVWQDAQAKNRRVELIKR